MPVSWPSHGKITIESISAIYSADDHEMHDRSQEERGEVNEPVVRALDGISLSFSPGEKRWHLRENWKVETPLLPF